MTLSLLKQTICIFKVRVSLSLSLSEPRVQDLIINNKVSENKIPIETSNTGIHIPIRNFKKIKTSTKINQEKP